LTEDADDQRRESGTIACVEEPAGPWGQLPAPISYATNGSFHGAATERYGGEHALNAVDKINTTRGGHQRNVGVSTPNMDDVLVGQLALALLDKGPPGLDVLSGVAHGDEEWVGTRDGETTLAEGNDGRLLAETTVELVKGDCSEDGVLIDSTAGLLGVCVTAMTVV
jgi:hypothetical protein